MRVLNEIFVASQSGASSFTSNPVPLGHLAIAAVQVAWTGTLTGAVKLQASCDVGTDSTTGAGVTTWSDLSGQTLSPAGSAANGILNLADIGYRWLRLVYTASSGSGSITATINGKGV